MACEGDVAAGDVAGGAEAGGIDADLLTYGENLGIDPEEDAELQWLVQEAFDAPLPVSWSEHTDDEGRVYFFNETTGESAWEHPMDPVYRELVRLVKQAQGDPGSASEASRGVFVHEHLRQVHQRALEAIEGWSGPYSSEAGEYYYNAELKASVWENPMARWEHELVLRHSVLCRCLLPERALVSADGLVEREPVAGRMSGQELLNALQLPLNLVKQRSDSESVPDTPSTTRSFHTARSMLSSRSQISSTRSGERRQSKDRKEHKERKRDKKEKSSGSRSVSFPEDPHAPPQAPQEKPQEPRTTIFSRPAVPAS